MALRAYQGRHRMPLVFGPTAGPRQGPDGGPFNWGHSPRTTSSVSFLTEAAAIACLLPPSCELIDEPVVTVEHTDLRELEWLAGRGYRMLGVKFPALYAGRKERLRTSFLSVVWENRPEPILSGREELGWAKLYCELPPPRIYKGRIHHSAMWDGHEFARMVLEDMAEGESPASPPPDFAGVLHHHYLPRVGSTGETEVEQMVLTPATGTSPRYDRVLRGKGSVEFLRSEWAQLPTMYHIVNALADLPVLEWRGASIIEARGGRDLSDQRILD